MCDKENVSFTLTPETFQSSILWNGKTVRKACSKYKYWPHLNDTGEIG